MILAWIVTVALAGWFGFELGRKWTAGEEEAVLEAEIERNQRPGIRMNRVTIRR